MNENVNMNFDLVSNCKKYRKSVVISIPTSSWKILQEFRIESDKLRDVNFVKTRFHGNLCMVWKNKELPKPCSKVIDYESFAVVLMRLRPFVHNNERTFFHKVKNILFKHIDIEAFRDDFRLISDMFEMKSEAIKISLKNDGVELLSFRSFMDYLNAFEYHRDKELANKTEKLFGPWMHEQDGTPIIAYMAVYIINAIFCLSDIIETLEQISIGKREEVNNCLEKYFDTVT
nr:hypothetical protein [uncultured Desulfobacter sp.]